MIAVKSWITQPARSGTDFKFRFRVFEHKGLLFALYVNSLKWSMNYIEFIEDKTEIWDILRLSTHIKHDRYTIPCKVDK
jgi:hypothetical protein